EAFAVISQLAAHGPRGERSWAYAQLSFMDVADHGDATAARGHGLQVLAEGGNATVMAEIALVAAEMWSGHDESALRYSTDLEAKSQVRAPEQTEAFFDENRLVATAWLEDLVGDNGSAARGWLAVAKVDEDQDIGYGSGPFRRALAATSLARNHDPAAARGAMGVNAAPNDNGLLGDDASDAFLALPHYWIGAEAGD